MAQEPNDQVPSSNPDSSQLQQELDRLRQENNALRELRESTLSFVKGESDPNQRVLNLGRILLEMGYDQDTAIRNAHQFVSQEIQAQRAPQTQPEAPEGDDPEPEETPQSKPPKGGDPMLDEIKKQNQELQAELRRIRARNVRDSINSLSRQAIEADPDAKAFWSKIETLRGGEGADKVRTAISEEIRKQALENLTRRRDAAGTFDEDWTAEEVTKASKQVVDRYRSVIGDVSKLGPAPETDSGEEFLRATKPVAPPKVGDTDESQLDAWMQDTLSRAAAEIATPSDSAV